MFSGTVQWQLRDWLPSNPAFMCTLDSMSQAHCSKSWNYVVHKPPGATHREIAPMQWLCTIDATNPMEFWQDFSMLHLEYKATVKFHNITTRASVWRPLVRCVLTLLTVLSHYVYKQGLHKPQVGPSRETLRWPVPKGQDDSWGFVTVSKIEPTPRRRLLDKLDLGLLQLDRFGIAWPWQIAPLRPTRLERWFLVSVTVLFNLPATCLDSNDIARLVLITR
jgi:hypothetical protein